MRPDAGMEINAARRLSETLCRVAYCHSLAKTDRNELLPRECHSRTVEIMLHRDDRINFARAFTFPCLRRCANSKGINFEGREDAKSNFIINSPHRGIY